MSAIEEFALGFLDKKELELADYLSRILGNPKCVYAGLLVSEIIPTYCEKRGESYYTLKPDPIYRPSYYLFAYANGRHFKENTRIFLDMAGAHLEGCLLWLTETPPEFRSPSKSFGPLVYELLREGILSGELADKLLRYNSVANVPAKHLGAFLRPNSRINERTFSCLEASLAFMSMRKLSIELFKTLEARGVNLPQGWKEFDDDWLSPVWAKRRSRKRIL
jgi:hypothetical protein